MPSFQEQKSIAILYEHPEWFNPLFDELESAGLPYKKLRAHEMQFDPEQDHSPYAPGGQHVPISKIVLDQEAGFFGKKFDPQKTPPEILLFLPDLLKSCFLPLL